MGPPTPFCGVTSHKRESPITDSSDGKQKKRRGAFGPLCQRVTLPPKEWAYDVLVLVHRLLIRCQAEVCERHADAGDASDILPHAPDRDAHALVSEGGPVIDGDIPGIIPLEPLPSHWGAGARSS